MDTRPASPVGTPSMEAGSAVQSAKPGAHSAPPSPLTMYVFEHPIAMTHTNRAASLMVPRLCMGPPLRIRKSKIPTLIAS
ncbi:MAG TPA: hypothetical protein VLT47_10940 [Anaeromyxobacteraceae bacterium]|nr:hypothetical protein [Anaeromyxobacteraceae bacterium]